MKIQINTQVIAKLNPCLDRFDNWKLHYGSWNGDIVDFILLPNITVRDKIWVYVRVVPRDVLEYFAVDCSFAAAAYADASYDDAAYAYAAYAAAAANAASYAAANAASYAAANAAAYAAASYAAANAASYAAAERERQVEAMIWLIEDEPSGEERGEG